MAEKENTAKCLCGAVRINAPDMAHEVGACHCATCRRWGGGPLMAVDCGSEVRIEGEAFVSVFDSSDWADRGFCSKCGAHLFYRLKETQQYIVPVGLFGDKADYQFDHQVFVDERPHYYRFENETSEMTGPELFAKYAPE